MLMLALLMLLPDPCTPLSGGPAQGMCPVQPKMPGPGFRMVELQPARDPGRPISPDLAAVIAPALKAHHSQRDLPVALLSADATSSFCEAWSKRCTEARPLVRWEVPVMLSPNRPYLMDDGRVRIEWMRNGTLVLLSFLQMREGKIAAIRTVPASMPAQTP